MSLADVQCQLALAGSENVSAHSASDSPRVQYGKRVPWTHDPARAVCCDHRHLTITETPTSVIGPDPLYALKCSCGSYESLQVGPPMQTEHATPTSAMGRMIRARFARKGTGYM